MEQQKTLFKITGLQSSIKTIKPKTMKALAKIIDDSNGLYDDLETLRT
ncbi:MAG: hypothetical protein R2783_04990 [Gelidibacter sp.]